MTVTIYNYTGEPNRILKDLGNSLASYAGNVRDSVDVVSPEILIDATITQGNYCYIDAFESYYFITEKTIVRTGLTIIRCKRDALKTFSAGILSSNCVCARNEKQYNSDFPDSKYSVLQGKYIETYAFYPLENNDAIIFAFVE